MTLEGYLRILRRYWFALVIGAIAGTLIALLVAFIQPKTYSADSSGFITTPNSAQSTGVGNAVAGDSYAKSRAKSYADLGKKRVVAENVIKDLGLSTTPEALVTQISVSVPTDTVNLKVTATASTPKAASDLANAWIRGMATEIEKLETGASSESGATPEQTTTPAATLTPLESASVPTSPTSPNTRLYAVIGFIIGLILAIGYALLRNQYDRRIRSTADVAQVSDAPVIGTVPFEKSLDTSKSRLSPDQLTGLQDARRDSNTRQLNEALRELRTNIEFIDVDNPPRAIVVTSALPGDGKSMVAANLAAVLAENGTSVVLIDGDLRKPTVAASFDVPGDVGLSDLLAGRITLEAALHRWRDTLPLFILPSGSVPPNPSELLGSKAMHELVEAFVTEGATVIIDAPPLLPVTDAAVLAARYSGAIIVAAAGRTRIDSLQIAVERVQAVKGKLLGVVLNRVPTKGSDRYAYGYYGGSYYGQSESSKDTKSTHRGRRRPGASASAHAQPTTSGQRHVAPRSVATAESYDDVLFGAPDDTQVTVEQPNQQIRPLLGDQNR